MATSSTARPAVTTAMSGRGHKDRREIRRAIWQAAKDFGSDEAPNLGITPGTLARWASDSHISPEEVGTLIAIRTEFGAPIRKVLDLVDEGETVERVYNLYAIRREIRDCVSFRGATPSIGAVRKLCYAFPAQDPGEPDGEGIASILSDVIHEAGLSIGGRADLEALIDALVDLAEDHGLSCIEAAAEALVTFARRPPMIRYDKRRIII